MNKLLLTCLLIGLVIGFVGFILYLVFGIGNLYCRGVGPDDCGIGKFVGNTFNFLVMPFNPFKSAQFRQSWGLSSHSEIKLVFKQRLVGLSTNVVIWLLGGLLLGGLFYGKQKMEKSSPFS